MKRQTCLFCVYFDAEEGFHGTEVTPATPDYLLCRKKHWGHLCVDDGTKDFRTTLLNAETCPDFIEVPEGK